MTDTEVLMTFVKSLTKEQWRQANRLHFNLLEMHPREYHTITSRVNEIKAMAALAFWPDDEFKCDLFATLVVEGTGL